jgi:hypothetical protein
MGGNIGEIFKFTVGCSEKLRKCYLEMGASWFLDDEYKMY